MAADELIPSDPDDDASSGGHMSFLDHLEELRGTLIRCVAVFLGAFILVAVFIRDVFDVLNEPFYQAAAGSDSADIAMTTATPMAIFSVIIQVCFLGALSLSLPFILYFIARFVAPALVEREKSVLRPFCLGAFALFFLGASFSYFIIVPSGIRVSIELNRMFGLKMFWTWDEYMSLVTWLVVIMGLSFQFPLIILILVQIGIVSTASLAKGRRYAIIGAFIAAAVITPTGDPFTQLLVAVPLALLYELSIILGRAIERRRKPV